MEQACDPKVVFFGCPLDCDEKHDAIQEKLDGDWQAGQSDDPYDWIMSIIAAEVPEQCWEQKGSIAVPDWLRPQPPAEDRGRMVVDNFIAFMDQDGCREVASRVQAFVDEQVLPHIPCLLTVDHSLSGGAYRALSQYYGNQNLSLVVLDSHTDAVPMEVMSAAIQYDMDSNPHSLYDPQDPFLFNRTDSYNASTFVHHLLDEEVVDPQNLYLIGVSDYPTKKALRIKDRRISSYVDVFTGLKRRGVKIVTKKECLTSPSKVKNMLGRLDTPFVYVSIDMDIGARSAVEGVRFRNWQGLQEKQIYRVAEGIRNCLKQDVRLAGLDIAEINPRRAGRTYPDGLDRTYRIAANLIKQVAFDLNVLK